MKVTTNRNKHDPDALVAATSRGEREVEFLFGLILVLQALKSPYSSSYKLTVKSMRKVSIVFKDKEIKELVKKLIKYGMIEVK